MRLLGQPKTLYYLFFLQKDFTNPKSTKSTKSTKTQPSKNTKTKISKQALKMRLKHLRGK